MKKTLKNIGKAMAFAGILAACNPLQLDEIQDPNNPSVGSVSNNASREQIQFLITGLESRHRGYVTNLSQAWNTFGREVWYLNASDPRFQTDWLGQNGRVPDRSYFGFGNTGGGSWASPYQAIKQAEVLIEAGANTNNIPESSKNAVVGFAKTIQGYQFMIPANFVYDNGIRIDVADPLNPGPFVPYAQALDAIKGILDEGEQALSSAGSGSFPFSLTRGFDGFKTIQGLRQVNRAITARLNAYRKDWQGVLTALDGSFMDLNGDLNTGPAHPYGAAPDIFNPLYYVPNAAINTIIVVHPSVLDDATPGDLRVATKFLERTTPVTVTTDAGALVGTHQDARWASNTTSIPFIKNEELILLKAEAHANLNQFTEAIEAIDIIRNAAGLDDYSGPATQDALIDEILYQRRYSLWAEPWGHRWIDARRYNKLDEIPTSYDGGTIFTQFPHPQAELSWDQYTGGN
ncbi:RagB/SusD family nutrient uptake outer membrane protein [Algoriphagus sp. CAU 1675]|uniref:RagB/SusD family nutrient uptake outer membrane protein n=1 Tax=Algoriphagus sp. CAU 1675 TaxID=3032597 RepID=UPI0023D9D250|nr:RagB/SusD family nutrient uptake outer membrane protein [Algoriphagus sp. CAU 1675]MDF2158594.1 RagB/SusD family nutrient uptake outer membrane protein [Algoriphagus sp. CAU 1675]